MSSATDDRPLLSLCSCFLIFHWYYFTTAVLYFVLSSCSCFVLIKFFSYFLAPTSSDLFFCVLFTANHCSNTYKTTPTVRVSPPNSPTGVQAEAQAVLDKRTGIISAIEITNPGSGYSSALSPVAVEVRVAHCCC